ncbi:XRE family transcriptional regulator [Dokdonella koreensis]|uniref:Helix-turn-helix domain protein n=1 Tax=Dokdonella koreensis DS-123 TaxID=1300342 RepID=A0A160DWI6_9GAMM|nr:XRE family transcriptional regulator [Dokdonella koreensis]ANB18987.1 Helix-turn-helix domain protein [Dokdonella koreensis DS-123]
MDQATIRKRLVALREIRGATQEQLATALQFNDRQTLSEIEGGGRSISIPELVKAAQFFGVKPDYFTDPLRLAGEAKFSWRRTMEVGENLNMFEERAGGWIATYRHLSRLKGDSINSSLTQIGLTPKSSYEEAWAAGEAIARSLELGPVPAAMLADALEERWDTLVLYVDALQGVSGAACQVGAMNTVIINRRESEGRRNFDLAHEVFHLITWSLMEPKHIEGDVQLSARYRRIESLADNFAAGLLMPSESLQKYIDDHPLPRLIADLNEWVRTAASVFLVSGDAMRWRLACLKHIAQATAKRLESAAIRVASENVPPPHFSRRFVEALGWGIEQGYVTVRRASEIVDESIDGLAELFTEHGLKTPFDM